MVRSGLADNGHGMPTAMLGASQTPRPDFTDPACHTTLTEQQMRTAILKGSQAIGRSNDMRRGKNSSPRKRPTRG